MLTNKQLTINQAAAKAYYNLLQRALDQKDFDFIAAEPTDQMDWTQIPQTLLDKFEELYGQAGKLKENQGE